MSQTEFQVSARFKRQARLAYLLCFVFPTLVVGSLGIALVSLLTLFQCRNFVMTKLVAPSSSFLLRLVGIKVRYEGPAFDARQQIYIVNHLSALDIFVMCSLGIPRCRNFLSVSTLRHLPLTVVGFSTGVFYLSEQTEPSKRVLEFKRACSILQRTRESALLTPEGLRNSGMALQKFNKGSFHLATELQADLQCLLIECPEECHPGLGLVAEAGTITVRNIGCISTAGWRLEQLDAHVAHVRNHYLEAMRLPRAARVEPLIA